MFVLGMLGVVALLMALGTITVSALYRVNTDVTRTFTGEGFPTNPPQTVTLSGLDTLTTLNGSTTPAISTDVCFTFALSSGTGTIDLTNITDPTRGTVTLSGLTPYILKIQNPSTNANPITIKEGASNGYTGFGANFLVELWPGEEFTLLKANATVVSGTVKTLDLAGTGAQAVNVQIAAG
jgi:hypothetical protein